MPICVVPKQKSKSVLHVKNMHYGSQAKLLFASLYDDLVVANKENSAGRRKTKLQPHRQSIDFSLKSKRIRLSGQRSMKSKASLSSTWGTWGPKSSPEKGPAISNFRNENSTFAGWSAIGESQSFQEPSTKEQIGKSITRKAAIAHFDPFGKAPQHQRVDRLPWAWMGKNPIERKIPDV